MSGGPEARHVVLDGVGVTKQLFNTFAVYELGLTSAGSDGGELRNDAMSLARTRLALRVQAPGQCLASSPLERLQKRGVPTGVRSPAGHR